MNFHYWQLPKPWKFIAYKYGCPPKNIYCFVIVPASYFALVHFQNLVYAVTYKKTNFIQLW